MQWNTINDICLRAMDLPEEDREHFVQRRCDGDAQLETRVRELLRATETDDDFLVTPAPEEVFAGTDADESSLRTGDRIGQYEVVRPISCGGMGSVVLARRADAAYERLVAIKVLRRHLSSEAMRQRFRQERETLARLRHPGITTLVDGGTTPDGGPYLVMEYVEGEPIVEYVNAGGLTIPARLRLFLEVCEAISHAHGMLVIHRDIKPSNVLVDGTGRARLIDFGIAKLLDPGIDPDPKAAPENTVTALRTPAYASPEQIRGGSVGTWTDVYGLGTLLFEMIVGRPPFGDHVGPMYELERQICEEPAPAPSSIARPESNRRRLRGDLDAIVARAIAKDPADRYPSAERLADDIRAHLDHRPIRATPEPARTRAVKFLRRNRVPVTAGSLIGASLLVAMAAVAMGAQRAERSAAQAIESRDDARLSTEVLQRVLAVADPLGSGGPRTVADVLVEAERQIDSIPVEAAGARARLHLVLATTYSSLSRYSDAFRHATEACAGFRPAADTPDGRLDLADALLALAGATTELAYQAGGAGAQPAVAALEEALALRRATLDPGDPAVAEAIGALSTATWVADPSPRGFRRGQALATQALSMYSAAGVHDDQRVVDVLNNLAHIHFRLGDPVTAEATYRRSLAVIEATPDVSIRSRHLVQSVLGDMAASAGRLDEARSRIGEVLSSTPPESWAWRHVGMQWAMVALNMRLTDAAATRIAFIAALDGESRVRAAADPTDPLVEHLRACAVAAAASDGDLGDVARDVLAAGSERPGPGIRREVLAALAGRLSGDEADAQTGRGAPRTTTPEGS